MDLQEYKNLLSLTDTVKTEMDAINLFIKFNVIPSSKVCQKGHNMKIKSIESSYYWLCCKGGCKIKISLKRNTWLEGFKFPFRKILLFIYCWSNELTTIKYCNKNFKMSTPTIVDYNSFLREVCADAIIKLNFSIGGEGQTVEIDETYVPKRKNNAGRILLPHWVFGGICRETKEVFLYSVPDRTEDTLTDCIKAKIKPGTTIFSDCFSSYYNIHKLDGFNFIHKTVNHSKNFVDPNTFAHTQTIENTWAQFKYKNKKRCGTHGSMLDSYLCEFVWRQKHANEDLFKAILNDIATYSYI